MPPRSERGLTLVEVLLAASIMAIISTLVASSLANTVRSRETVDEVQARYHMVNVALNRMAREISMAHLSCNYDTQLAEPKVRTLFVGESTGVVDELTFSSTGHLRVYRDGRETDQNVVTYYGERDDENGGNRIMRLEKLRIGDKDENLDRDSGQAMVMAEGVEMLEIEYWDKEDEDWKDEWDSTNVERQDRLPSRVRLTLQLRLPGGKKDEKYMTQVRIPRLKAFGVGPDGNRIECGATTNDDVNRQAQELLQNQLNAQQNGGGQANPGMRNVQPRNNPGNPFANPRTGANPFGGGGASPFGGRR